MASLNYWSQGGQEIIDFLTDVEILDDERINPVIIRRLVYWSKSGLKQYINDLIDLQLRGLPDSHQPG